MSEPTIHLCQCPNCQGDTPHPERELHRQMNVLLSRLDQQFPLMTFGSYTTYVGGRLSEHFDHPFLSFEATCTIRTDTIPGGKQVHFAVQA